jgi:membrane protein DedA with SNARE-associated domain
VDAWLNNLIAQAIAALAGGNVTALAALFFIVVLTELGIPFPFVLDSAVFLSAYQNGPISIDVLRVVLVVFAGREVGASAVYLIGRLLGGRLMDWVSRRFKSVENGLAIIQSRLSSKAFLAVAMSRLTSLLTLVSIASGTIRIPYPSFCLGVALSALIFDGSLVLLGFITDRWFHYLNVTPSLWLVTIGLVALMIIIWAGTFLFGRLRRSNGRK